MARVALTFPTKPPAYVTPGAK